MSYRLFLDDERFPEQVTWVRLPSTFREDWVIVRDFWEFKTALRERGTPDFVAFDHDLGWSRARSIREHTGQDCAHLLVMHCMRQNVPLPPFVVHSMNPVGAKRIQEIMSGEY